MKLLTRDAIMAALEYCDGHTVWEVSAIEKTGLPEDFIKELTKVHKSDTGDFKSTIFGNKGEVIPKLEGIYGKDLAEAICTRLRIDTFTSKLGRGNHVSVLRERILAHLGATKT